MSTTTRPRGRRPGNDDTRGTIREAARTLFGTAGYDRVSLRAIARQADVDPALVHHYFDSKADLFAQSALSVQVDIKQLLAVILDGEPETTGERAVRAFLQSTDEPRTAEAYRELILGGGERVERLRAMHEFTARELYQRVAEHFGHENATLRGQLASATVLGLFSGRSVLQMRPLSAISVRTLVASLGPVLQHLLVEPW